MFVLYDLPGPWLHALVQDHLRGHDRLMLFRVSKGMAALVMKHAASVELALNYTASGRHNLQTIAYIAERQELQQQAPDSVLTAAPKANLQVCISDSKASCKWGDSIRKHLTRLTLNLDLTAGMLQNQLQLQQCNQLQTLTLAHFFCCTWSPEQLKQLAAQRQQIFPPSLTELNVSQGTSFANSSAAVRDFLYLLGPQLVHLHCESWEEYYSTSGLVHLTRISLLSLTDNFMHALKAMPSVTHVTAHAGCLQQDHKHTLVRLQELTVFSSWGSSAEWLLHLPVHDIQHIVVQDSIMCKEASTARQLADHLSTCPRLQMAPEVRQTGLPTFAIQDSHTAELVMLCVKNMTDNGGLSLEDISFAALQDLLPCISRLPQNVSQLRIEFERDIFQDRQQMTAEQRVQTPQQLVSALPQHVKELVIVDLASYPTDDQTDKFCMYASAIAGEIRTTQCPTKLIAVLMSGVVPKELQALAEAHPEHVCIFCYGS